MAKRTIPQIRQRLTALAIAHRMPELAVLADELKREPAVRRAPAKRRKVTPALVRQVKEYAETYANADMAEIATEFNLNPGRVSEILNGKY